VSFKGDFRALGQLVERIGKVAKGDFVKRSADALGRMAYGMAQQSVASGRSPAGRPWKRKKDGGRPLELLAGSLGLSQPSDTSFKIASAIPWAIFHQTGARKIKRAGGFKRTTVDGQFALKRVKKQVGWRLPKRPMLPYGKLPKAWSEPMVRRLLAEWSRSFR
jgi:hypothetical protein